LHLLVAHCEVVSEASWHSIPQEHHLTVPKWLQIFRNSYISSHVIPAELACLGRKNDGPHGVCFTRCNAVTRRQKITPMVAKARASSSKLEKPGKTYLVSCGLYLSIGGKGEAGLSRARCSWWLFEAFSVSSRSGKNSAKPMPERKHLNIVGD